MTVEIWILVANGGLALIGALALLLWRMALSSLSDRIGNVERRIDAFDSRISRHGEEIVRIDTGARASADTLTRLDATLTRLDEKIDRLLGMRSP